MLQLSKKRLVVTTEDEIKARKEAIKSIVEKRLEIELDFHDDSNRDLEHAKQIQKEMETLGTLEKQHEERVEHILKDMQMTLEAHKKDMEQIKTDFSSQQQVLHDVKEVLHDVKEVSVLYIQY